MKSIIRGVSLQDMLLAVSDKITVISFAGKYISVMQTYTSSVELHGVLIRGLASTVLEPLEKY